MTRVFALALALTVSTGGLLQAERVPSLRGSPASMQEQNRVAKDHGLAFYRTATEIRRAVADGALAELRGNDDYAVADFVQYPYLRPEVVLFVERLGAQYREACGQRLVVTSAVRPTSEQPSNAHSLSVHPAGMAVDLRVSDRAECRSWIEMALMNLERQGVINGIREFRPPHYHVAVFPEPYLAYAQERMLSEPTRPVEEMTATAEVERLVEAAGSSLLPAEQPTGGAARRSLRIAVAALTIPFGLGVILRRLR
jgi:hypothetical protein